MLSGGASHGFAHLGVLKALREYNIKPGIISGVSVGSIVGSFYCDGYQPEEILEMFEKNKIYKLVKLKIKRHGLFNISGLKETMQNNLKSENIEDLDIPLVIAATNIKNGTIRYFTKGNLVERVMASSSIPVLVNPVKIDGELYVDGGVTDNFPIDPLVNICKEIIGINVNPIGQFDPKSKLGQLALHTFHLRVSSGIKEKKKLLKYYFEPRELKTFSYWDITKARDMFEIGYDHAIEVLEPSKK